MPFGNVWKVRTTIKSLTKALESYNVLILNLIKFISSEKVHLESPS